MKKTIILMMFLLLGFSMKSLAADLVEVHNKFCPISHEEVGKDGMTPYKETYNGKVYSLCCSMCKKDFEKDPAKYAQIMDDEAAKEAQAK